MMLLNISFIINFVIYELFVTYAIFVFIRLIYFIYVFNKNEWFASLITDDILIVLS